MITIRKQHNQLALLTNVKIKFIVAINTSIILLFTNYNDNFSH